MGALPPFPNPAACRAVDGPPGIEVSWAAPEDPDQRARLDAECRSLGPVVIHGRLASVPQHSAGDLVVLSWNTYLGRGDLAALLARLRRGDFTAGVPVNRFALVLQEVFRSQIVAFADASRLDIVYAPARLRPDERDDRGAAILATVPMRDVLVVELPFEKERRIALVASLETADSAGEPRLLQLVNAHFDTNVGLLRGGPSAARLRQARALIEAVAMRPPPILIGADLNTWWGDDEPAVRKLRRAFPDAEPIRARETWRGPLGTGNKLDYIFARGTAATLRVRRLDDRFGSDHWPLLTVVPKGR